MKRDVVVAQRASGRYARVYVGLSDLDNVAIRIRMGDGGRVTNQIIIEPDRHPLVQPVAQGDLLPTVDQVKLAGLVIIVTVALPGGPRRYALYPSPAGRRT